MKNRLIWVMTEEFHLILAYAAMLYFLLFAPNSSASLYYILTIFLTGAFTGFGFGCAWRSIIRKNWDFYKKFYDLHTKHTARMKMFNEKLKYEWSIYACSILMGVMLSQAFFKSIAIPIYFLIGFITAGAVSFYLILRELS